MLVRADAVTVKVAVPLTVPEVAVMVADPGVTAFANPELLTAAMVLSELVQARFFGFTVLPSSLVPVAVNCWVPPFPMEGFAGFSVMDVSTGFTKNPWQATNTRISRKANPEMGKLLRLSMNNELRGPRYALPGNVEPVDCCTEF